MQYIGGLVGNLGKNAQVTHSYSESLITSGTNIGGLIGQLLGSVCNSYAIGNVDGSNYLGGFIGWMLDTASVCCCYATGYITSTGNHVGGFVGNLQGGGHIMNSYCLGDIKRTSGLSTGYGGFIGSIYNSKVTNSYSIGSVSYQTWTPTDKGFVGSVILGDIFEMAGNYWDAEKSGQQKTGEIPDEYAIGKTTFVKILAGVEKADEGEIGLGLKVSYKPQYIIPEKNISVQELFDLNKIDKSIFKTQINRRLNVNELSEKKVEQLSGGELQKVAVSLALAREDYDLLLLDEPSAFVDAEDRVAMAETIRGVIDERNKTAFIVDHDILFIDYVSDRLMVFDGIPSIKGNARKPVAMHEGMNSFLKQMNISFRRDSDSGRPRANKLNSVKDREQKERGEYYYKL